MVVDSEAAKHTPWVCDSKSKKSLKYRIENPVEGRIRESQAI